MSNGKSLDELVSDFLKQDETGTLQAYVGISESTSRRWRSRTCKPAGYPRVKAMHFLNKQGYPCAELLALPEQVRTLGELISDGKVGINQAVKAVDAKSEHKLLAILLGRWNCTFERLRKIDTLAADTKPAQEGDQRHREQVIKALAALIAEAQPLVARLVSNEFTPEDRAHTRKLVGEMNFFRFSNQIDQLCGGKAVLQGTQQPKTQTTEE